MPGTGRLFYYVKNTVGRGIELEAGRWLKTWEVEKGRRMGKQSGEKGPQVKGWLSGAAMLDARAERPNIFYRLYLQYRSTERF